MGSGAPSVGQAVSLSRMSGIFSGERPLSGRSQNLGQKAKTEDRAPAKAGGGSGQVANLSRMSGIFSGERPLSGRSQDLGQKAKTEDRAPEKAGGGPGQVANLSYRADA